jgi:hypothetical protein
MQAAWLPQLTRHLCQTVSHSPLPHGAGWSVLSWAHINQCYVSTTRQGRLFWPTQTLAAITKSVFSLLCEPVWGKARLSEVVHTLHSASAHAYHRDSSNDTDASKKCTERRQITTPSHTKRRGAHCITRYGVSAAFQRREASSGCQVRQRLPRTLLSTITGFSRIPLHIYIKKKWKTFFPADLCLTSRLTHTLTHVHTYIHNSKYIFFGDWRHGSSGRMDNQVSVFLLQEQWMF